MDWQKVTAMNVTELRTRYPKAFRIYTMRRQGMQWDGIAVRVGVTARSAETIGNAIARIIKQNGSGMAAQYPDRDIERPRCKCGLSLPCEDCIPNIYETALGQAR